ncbi:MAG: hypothetical protein M1829_001556 [Trizodia sp. TS-e1964]|nr:MAG: hypothetical protein M1829_001556 [Trizodia sp. TS-e1964]
MAHSKRNTSLAFFTSHERSLLKATWGSQSTRLTRDSFLPFSSCRLCLLPARSPVACASNGDIFCRECAMSNLLAQRKEIARLENLEKKEQEEIKEEELRGEEEAKLRVIKEFEKVQMGLEAGSSRHGVTTNTDGTGLEGMGAGGEKKRKYEADEEEKLRIAREETTKARKALDEEKAEASKSRLPSFWVPSQTPNFSSAAKGPLKIQPLCPASSTRAPHPYSLKTLVTVNFTEDKDGKTGELVRVCPSCRKGLSNGSKAMLTKPCGHVICKPCVEKFMKPNLEVDAYELEFESSSLKCFVCETDLSETGKNSKGTGVRKEKKSERITPGMVEINSEGTGFAGALGLATPLSQLPHHYATPFLKEQKGLAHLHELICGQSRLPLLLLSGNPVSLSLAPFSYLDQPIDTQGDAAWPMDLGKCKQNTAQVKAVTDGQGQTPFERWI